MSAHTNLNEYDAIAKTVQYYTDGAKSGRGADMQPAFHQDATIFGYADGEIFAGPIQKLLTLLTRTPQLRGSKPGWSASTSSTRLPRCGWNSTTGTATATPICSRSSKPTGSGRS